MDAYATPMYRSSARSTAMTRARLLGCALAAVLAGSAGCNAGGDQPSDPMAGELLVFAAASLTDAFTAVAREFEKTHPKVKVTLNFAGSQSLRTQIENGASPGVFASANQQHMDLLRKAELIEPPIVFAHNELVIAVPTRNPAGIRKLADLVNAERLVLAGANVPAGAYAETVLANADGELGAGFSTKIMARVVSREVHVRHTLQKVALGEADAALVYATDAASSEQVDAIEIPASVNVVADYPIAAVRETSKPKLAALFLDFIQSEPARRKLAEFGFRPPGTQAP